MRKIVGGLLALLLLSAPALAHEPGSPPGSVSLRQAIKTTKIDVQASQARRAKVPSRYALRAKPNAGARTAIVAGAVVGGFLGGLLLGEKIERAIYDCACDDPGVRGALIGAPTGAVIAGIVTFKLTK